MDSRKHEERLWNRYQNWLLDRIGFHDRRYTLLMEILHNTTFIFIIDMDQNRAEDGIALREIFYDEADLEDDFSFKRDAKVLEVLIALAFRMENEYVGDPGDPHPDRIFWRFLVNLGLDKQRNDRINADFVVKTVKNWMIKNHKFNGIGGIFPLKNPKVDQREIEIWSQMQEYIDENY